MYIRIEELIQLKHLNKNILNGCEYLLNSDQTEIEIELEINKPIINRSPYHNVDNLKIKIVKRILTDKKYDLIFYIKYDRFNIFDSLFKSMDENFDFIFTYNQITKKIENKIFYLDKYERETFDYLMILYSNKYQELLDKPKEQVTKEQVKQAIADTMIIVYEQLYGK